MASRRRQLVLLPSSGIVRVEVQITDPIRRGSGMVRHSRRGAAVRGLVHVHVADDSAQIVSDGEEVQVEIAQYVNVAAPVRPVTGLVGLQPARFDHGLQLRLVSLLVPVEGGLEGVVAGNDEVLDDALLSTIDDAAVFEVRGRPEPTGYALLIDVKKKEVMEKQWCEFPAHIQDAVQIITKEQDCA